MGKRLKGFKRRKVFRVAAVYSVVAWLLIQVANTVMPALQMPAWTVSFATILFILGFPIALILAWAYEVTPQGIPSDVGSQAVQNNPQLIDQKLIYATFALVLIVAGFQIADRFLGENSIAITQTPNSPIRDDIALEVARFNINLGTSLPRLYETLPTDLAISPNGQNIAYTIHLESGSELYVRNTRELEPKMIFSASAGVAYAAFKPKFSPNGQQLLFGSDKSLLLMPVAGGSPRIVSNSIETIGGWGWISDNELVYVSDEKKLVLHSLSSNNTRRLITPDTISPRWPEGLLSKNAFLYTALDDGSEPGGSSVNLFDLETGESTIVLGRGAYQASYVSSGHIVFARGSSIWAAPFDIDSMEFVGAEVPIENGISSFNILSESIFAVSDSGRLAYLPRLNRNAYSEPRIPVWVDRDGNEEAQLIEAAAYFSPRISPDGNRLALLREEPSRDRDILIWNFASSRQSRLTFSGDTRNPVWSPDGSQVMYFRYNAQAEESGIWQFSANGLGQPQKLLPNSNREGMLLLADPRNNRLLYRIGQGTINNEIHSLSLNGDASSELLIPAADQYEAALSPDGNWIAIARRDGVSRVGIYVSPYPNTVDGNFQVAAMGRQPSWGPNSDEIFYIDDYTRILHSARVVSKEPFITEQGPIIARNIHFDINIPPSYDVSPDGKRFLVLKYQNENFTQEQRLDLVIVDNWFEELKRLAPITQGF